jgi:hypothetical protein
VIVGQSDVFRSIGPAAGLAGLVVGMIVILFKEIIRKRIFPLLPKRDAYRLLRTILVLAWSLAIVGIGSWTYLEVNAREVPSLPKAAERLVIAGTVIDYRSNLGIGQAQIEVDGLKDVFSSEDSGNFRIELPPSKGSVERRRLTVRKSGYRPLDTSVMPPVQNVILALKQN